MIRIWFGFSPTLARARAHAISDDLSVLWRRQMGKSIGDLNADLESLDRWFNPLISGGKLREQLTGLEPVERDLEVGQPFILNLPRARCLVTHEGRLLMGELHAALQENHRDPVVLSATRFDSAIEALILCYRDLVHRKIDSITKYQDLDRAPALHPAGIGVLLFLLINRSTRPKSRGRTSQRLPGIRRG